jgi:hypothetical protein
MTLFSQRYLLADIDDTVLEFAKCFQDWAVARGHPANGNVRENGDIGRVFGIDDQACWNLIEEFYADPSFGELTPEPDALEILPVLHEFGCEFVAITACDDSPQVVEKRRRNLRNAFGFEWQEVHCTGLGNGKETFLKSYEPTVFVEDNFKHAVAGSAIGHQSFLLDRPYNRELNHPHVIRVKGWHDIARSLLGTAYA